MKIYALAGIWHPEFVVANDDGSVKRTLPEKADVTSDGTLIYRQRLTGSFAERLDLRAFPFDQHRFGAHFLIVETPTLADWKWRGAVVKPYRAAPGLQIAGYPFEFHATRGAQYYLLKVILPLLLVVMMSWTVSWIDPTNGELTASLLG